MAAYDDKAASIDGNEDLKNSRVLTDNTDLSAVNSKSIIPIQQAKQWQAYKTAGNRLFLQYI